jgi:hypothetical protein
VTGPVIRSEGLAAGPPANAGTVNVAQPVVLAYETGLTRPGWLAKAQHAGLDADRIEALVVTRFQRPHGPARWHRRVHQEKATLREAHGWAHAAGRHATVALWSPAPRSCWPPPC